MDNMDDRKEKMLKMFQDAAGKEHMEEVEENAIWVGRTCSRMAQLNALTVLMMSGDSLDLVEFGSNMVLTGIAMYRQMVRQYGSTDAADRQLEQSAREIETGFDSGEE